MRRGHVAEQRLRSSRLVLKTAATRGSARGLRRRHRSGNVSTTQQKAHKTPAAATARTPKLGLEITTAMCVSLVSRTVTLRDTPTPKERISHRLIVGFDRPLATLRLHMRAHFRWARL